MQYKQKWLQAQILQAQILQAQILQHALIFIYTEIKFYFLTWLILQLWIYLYTHSKPVNFLQLSMIFQEPSLNPKTLQTWKMKL